MGYSWQALAKLRSESRKRIQELTPTQVANIPYAQEVRQEKEQERTRIQPLKILFDLLSRGQYASANIVDEIIESVRNHEPFGQGVQEALAAAIQGLTGKRKGDYEEVIKKYLTPEQLEKWTKPFLGEKQKGKFLLGANPASVLGFLGNVLLDPLTYVGVGPTKAARATADDFAKAAVKLERFKLIDGLRSMGKSDDVIRAAAKSDDALAKAVGRGAKDLSRYFDDVVKTAKKQALRQSPEQLAKTWTGDVGQQLDIEKAAIKNLSEEDLFKFLKENKAERMYSLQDMMGMEKRWAHAGERRTMDFFGKETGVSIREPNRLVKAWDALGARMGDTAAGKTFKDAWWTMMNKGPVGFLKRKLGMFRNPYEQYLRNLELEEMGQTFTAPIIGRKSMEFFDFRNGVDDQTIKDSVKALEEAEDIWTKTNNITAFDILTNPEKLKELGIKDPEKTAQFTRKVHDFLSGLRNAETVAYKEGAFSEPYMQVIENYLPTMRQDTAKMFRSQGKGVATPSVGLSRQFGRKEAVDIEARKFAFVFGIDEASAKRLVQEKGLSAYVTDFDQLILSRIQTHAKMMERANIVKTFKEFGIPDSAEVRKLAGVTGGIEQLGLRQIGGLNPDPAFKGMLFDREVADILEKVNMVTTPKNYETVTKFIKGYTSWWKGMVTMTTGFHARNFMSNQVTGFMKSGAKWFNPKTDLDALAITIYALAKDNPETLLSKTMLDSKTFQRILNTRKYAGKSGKELGDYVKRYALASEATMGFDIKETAKTLGKPAKNFNPVSTKFIGMEMSHKLGSVIESQARVKSFLIDLMDAGGKEAPEVAMEFAKKEAKKWFIDYTDLTDMEKGFMKNVIPFYSWLRHNLANQVSGIIHYPQMYSMFPKIMNQAKSEDPNFDEKFIPEWMKQLGMVPVQVGGQTGMFNPNFPFQDWNKIPLMFEEGRAMPVAAKGAELRDDILAAAHPWVKQFVEVFATGDEGYDIFYRTQMYPTKKAPLALRALTKYPHAVQFLDGIMRLGGRNGMHIGDKDGKLYMDSKWAKVIEENIPWFKTIENVVLAGREIAGVDEAIEANFAAKDDYEGLEQTFQVLSRWMGVKFKQPDIEAEKERLRKEIYNEANKRRLKEEGVSASAQLRNDTRTSNLNRAMRRVVGF